MMKKKLKKIILGLVLILCISNIMACNRPRNVNVNISDKDGNIVSVNDYGIANLASIGGGLYYDILTGIVYFWNGEYATYSATMPTPYYSENGKLFTYNPHTNSFTEVEDNNMKDEAKKKGLVTTYER